MKHILAMGVFDLFHIGHLRYLQYAKKQGDYLSVAVCPDAICKINKSKIPIIPQEQRLEIVQSQSSVDYVALMPSSVEDTLLAAKWIVEWNINHVVVGGEWLGSSRWNRLIPILAQHDITVSFAPKTEGISTTDILNRIRGKG